MNSKVLSQPVYQLRVTQLGPSNASYAIWQLPTIATPQIDRPCRIARLQGRNLAYVENTILRRLNSTGVKLNWPENEKEISVRINEDLALWLGLLFLTLAPMRKRENMRMVIQGIDAMGREESSYWLGMTMYRKKPRKVLASLRNLLMVPSG